MLFGDSVGVTHRGATGDTAGDKGEDEQSRARGVQAISTLPSTFFGDWLSNSPRDGQHSRHPHLLNICREKICCPRNIWAPNISRAADSWEISAREISGVQILPGNIPCKTLLAAPRNIFGAPPTKFLSEISTVRNGLRARVTLCYIGTSTLEVDDS